MTWIIRLFFIIAAPIAAILVARDSLSFEIVQTFVAIVLMVAMLVVAAVWTIYPSRSDRT